MSQNGFNRDKMAKWYAERHLKIDPGTKEVHYLPTGAPDKEIRFLEVNTMIANRDLAPLEAQDFGVAIEGPEQHTLMVLDVTPEQWRRIARKELALPSDWSLENEAVFKRNKK